jgi:lipopolysaccharide transport system ATP-binding protein
VGVPRILWSLPLPRWKPVSLRAEVLWPTVLHVTHPKAGSQWVRKVLEGCCPERCVTPTYGLTHFLRDSVKPGKLYPTLYVSRQQLDAVPLPRNTRRFVIIRDLRDTLISWYFSVKVSHTVEAAVTAAYRAILNRLSIEDGLIWALHEAPHFAEIVNIQRSWQEAGEPLVRYEDLLEHDVEIFTRLLLDQCRLPVRRAHLQSVIRACRFEQLTGRPRGVEDVSCHERKGIAGDWRNHFTDRVRQAFKACFGDVLVATGYERNSDW